MFSLVRKEIDQDKLMAEIADPSAGGIAVFEGRVRNHNLRKKVAYLEYEAFDELVLSEMSDIISEAESQFAIKKVACCHRLGQLAIGETAVWVGVSAAHRKDAFLAARYLIDEIKKRAPIWKKEAYEDGKADWVDCAGCHSSELDISFDAKTLYQRIEKLKEIGPDGLRSMQNARVALIGAGGIGCPLAQLLSMAGIGMLSIYDFDQIEASNLSRQMLFTPEDVGKQKSSTAARHLRQMNPFVKIAGVDLKVDRKNIEKVVEEHDIVIDATDNFSAKFAIADAAHLQKKAYFGADVFAFEGQINIFLPQEDDPCHRCLDPVEPELGCQDSCEEIGIMPQTVSFFASLLAQEVTRYVSQPAAYYWPGTLLYNLKTRQQTVLETQVREDCLLCSKASKKNLADLQDENSFAVGFDEALKKKYNLINITKLNSPSKFIQTLPSNLPLPQLEEKLRPLKPVALLCQRGVTAAKLAHNLRSRGIEGIYYVDGGIDSAPDGFF